MLFLFRADLSHPLFGVWCCSGHTKGQSKRCAHLLPPSGPHVWEGGGGTVSAVFDVHTCMFFLCVCCVCPLQVHCMLSFHDIHISYLPLAHMFERVVQVCYEASHIALHFFSPMMSLPVTLFYLNSRPECQQFPPKLLLSNPPKSSLFKQRWVNKSASLIWE